MPPAGWQATRVSRTRVTCQPAVGELARHEGVRHARVERGRVTCSLLASALAGDASVTHARVRYTRAACSSGSSGRFFFILFYFSSFITFTFILLFTTT